MALMACTAVYYRLGMPARAAQILLNRIEADPGAARDVSLRERVFALLVRSRACDIAVDLLVYLELRGDQGVPYQLARTRLLAGAGESLSPAAGTVTLDADGSTEEDVNEDSGDIDDEQVEEQVDEVEEEGGGSTARALLHPGALLPLLGLDGALSQSPAVYAAVIACLGSAGLGAEAEGLLRTYIRRGGSETPDMVPTEPLIPLLLLSSMIGCVLM